jgi:hypothetical protein
MLVGATQSRRSRLTVYPSKIRDVVIVLVAINKFTSRPEAVPAERAQDSLCDVQAAVFSLPSTVTISWRTRFPIQCTDRL